jgi:anhydro-N-acetylmuramic acid kinase
MNNTTPKKYYIGIMSGTSMDAIDAALVDFSDNKLKILATHRIPMPEGLKKQVLQLMQNSISLAHFGEIDRRFGILFADAALGLINKKLVPREQIEAIGSHGQTIFHQPLGDQPFTMQIGDPNIISAKTGITTIADFRRKDMAFGGQGAPLAPAFHGYLFRSPQDCFVVNIGGIANVTYLAAKPSENIVGFDTGPGNTLLDQWCKSHKNTAFDNRGAWAQSGIINEKLLALCLQDPYFHKAAPKSTGREYFNLSWLKKRLMKVNLFTKAEDVQATITELTARTIAEAIMPFSKNAQKIWVCGGGAKNTFLMSRLQQLCQPMMVLSAADFGVDPDWIEAAAFAWLAKQTLEQKTGNIPSVTGAQKSAILGGIYFA